MNANGAFTYRPPPNFNGIVRFRYRANDAYGGRDSAMSRSESLLDQAEHHRRNAT